MADDRDLWAVRTLVEPRQHGAPPAWRAVAARLETPLPLPPGRRAWLRLEVPVLAVAVLVAVVGVVVLLRWYGHGEPGSRGLPGEVAISPTPGASAEFRAVGDPGPYPDVEPADPQAVLAGLATVARDAGPVAIAPGQFVYQRIVGWIGGTIQPGTGDVVLTTTHGPVIYQEKEWWYDPQGMIEVPTAEQIAAGPAKADLEGGLAQARQRFATEGPSLGQPTAQWLAQLPTDPARLGEVLLPPGGPKGSWSDNRELFDRVLNLLRLAGPLLTGDLRVGLLRLLGGLPNLTAARLVADGQPLVAIRYTETMVKAGQSNTSTEEILFDPATGRAVGLGALGMSGGSRYQALWTQSVVNTLGDRQ